MTLQNSTQATDKDFREVTITQMIEMLENQLAHLNERSNRLAKIISELMGIEGGNGTVVHEDGATVQDNTPVTTSNGPPPRRIMSAAAKKRISDAQKARWAKVRAKKTGKRRTKEATT